MFDGLKKKLASAVKTFVKSEAAEEQNKAPDNTTPAPAEQPIQIEDEALQPQDDETISNEPEKEASEANKESQDAVKLSIATKVKKIFRSSVKLNENEIDNFLDQVKISLLQSDVSLDVAEYLINDMKTRLSGAEIDSKDMTNALFNVVKDALADMLGRAKPGIDIYSYISHRISSGMLPVKILFIGSNGTGKTTTIGKIAYSLKAKDVSCVMSASDTFRAAAIEQTEYHANKIGVPVVKSSYGADPASIAFDAIAYAKARNISVVLIDSAGRQETNKNLINEMQKIVRVAQPDITVFVGESTAGSVIAEQVNELSKHVKIDGIILTKLDCDARGGNALSISNVTGIPILFFGVGEAYDAIVPYSPEFIIKSVIPN
jgi:fused signal recognition particle receptor